MGRKLGGWFGLVLVCFLVLSGCGKKANKVVPAPTAVSGSAVDPDADIKSGCWTAADRGLGVGLDAKGAYQQWKRPPTMVIDTNKTYTATIVTSAGTISVELYPKDAPNTVNSFVCLARAGYFDNTLFHRIKKDFVIQGGDPTATGTGGPGYQFDDEPIEKEYLKGIVAMANSGPDTNGSQFFICTDDLQTQLSKAYTIFGKVTTGMDVVDALNNTPTKLSASGEQSAPIDPVKLISVSISEA